MVKIISGGKKTSTGEDIPAMFDVAGGEQFLSPSEKITYKVETTMKELDAKKAAESAENYNLAMGKLFQSNVLINNINEYNKKVLGIDIPAEFGGRGLLNWTQKYTKTNPWVKTFLGDQNTTAMFATRAIMPTRAVKMVEMFKESLPDIWSSDGEIMAQSIQSMADIHLTWAAKNPKMFPELIPTKDVDENLRRHKAFRKNTIAKTTKMLIQVRDEIRNAPPEALRPDGVIMMSPTGQAELTMYPSKEGEFGEIAEKYSEGYKLPTQEDVEYLKFRKVI